MLIARKRTAIDGKVWWCVYDTVQKRFSTLTCFGMYQTKKAAETDIRYQTKKYNLQKERDRA